MNHPGRELSREQRMRQSNAFLSAELPSRRCVLLGIAIAWVVAYFASFGWGTISRHPVVLFETLPSALLLGWLCLPVNLLYRCGIRLDLHMTESIWHFAGAWLYVAGYWATSTWLLVKSYTTRRVLVFLLFVIWLLVSAYGCYENLS